MLWLMKSGGGPIWFIALFGLIGLVSAVRFARRPDARRLAFIRFMSRAIAWSVGAGVTASLAAVFLAVPHRPEWANSPTVHLIVMEGIAESMSPGILGFTVLSLMAFITAIGVRRMPDQET